MSKPLSKMQIQLKKMKRLQSKSIQQLLLYRFLNHYGYDKGTVTARAIIDDILQIIDDYFLVSSLDDDLHHIHYGQLVWLAVPVDEFPQRGKSLAGTLWKHSITDLDHISRLTRLSCSNFWA